MNEDVFPPGRRTDTQPTKGVDGLSDSCASHHGPRSSTRLSQRLSPLPPSSPTRPGATMTRRQLAKAIHIGVAGSGAAMAQWQLQQTCALAETETLSNVEGRTLVLPAVGARTKRIFLTRHGQVCDSSRCNVCTVRLFGFHRKRTVRGWHPENEFGSRLFEATFRRGGLLYVPSSCPHS